MESTKLTAMLRTFDTKEMKEFEKFITSPYHSGSRDLMPLFTEIKKFYPKFNSPKFTKEEIFKKAFKGKKFDEGYFRKMLSFLYKMGEDFLVELELKEKRTERNLLLLRQFRMREMESAFLGLSESIDKDLQLKDHKLEDYYSNRLRYTMEKFEYYYEFKSNYEKALSLASDHLESATGQFVYFFLKGLVARKISEKNFGGRFSFSLLETLEKSFDVKEFFELETQKSEALNLLLISYFIERAIAEPDRTEHLDKAIDLFLTIAGNLSQSIKYSYFRELLNATTNQTFSAKSDELRQRLRRKYFELTKLKFEFNAILPPEKKYISMLEYSSILKNALGIREFEWAEKLITDHNNLIETPHRKNIKEYSYAMLLFVKGKFEKSLEHLALIKPTTHFIKYDVRELMMGIYYELRSSEEARYLINNSQRYFDTTNELGGALKRKGLNFLKYYRMLIKYLDDGDKEIIAMNYPKLRDEKAITSKSWLMGKFREITGESL